MLYDKSFQDISSGRMELFSSFFSAIKSFIKELVLEGSTELKNIELGDYTVLITSVPDVQADLVMIADKEDYKVLNKLIPKILKILLKHKQLFLEWDGNREQFMVLDKPLTELILKKKKKLISDESLVEKPEELLQSIWTHKEGVDDEQKNRLVKERDFLIERIPKTTNLLRKLEIAKEVLNLSEKLKDEKSFLKYQKKVKSLKDKIKDTKYKLEYYLEKVKISLNNSLNNIGNKSLRQGDYKDAYLNLYSFSTKLRSLTEDNSWEKYRNLAKALINKNEKENREISNTISEILNMKENIDYYLD
ncbi:MAG: hypothetical protein ACOC44_04850 [Promethearchaeia archaeon]